MLVLGTSLFRLQLHSSSSSSLLLRAPFMGCVRLVANLPDSAAAAAAAGAGGGAGGGSSSSGGGGGAAAAVWAACKGRDAVLQLLPQENALMVRCAPHLHIMYAHTHAHTHTHTHALQVFDATGSAVARLPLRSSRRAVQLSLLPQQHMQQQQQRLGELAESPELPTCFEYW